jgi:hypothetical protein
VLASRRSRIRSFPKPPFDPAQGIRLVKRKTAWLSGITAYLEDLELCEDRVQIAEGRAVIAPGQLNETGVGNVLREVACRADVGAQDVRPGHDERRNANQREDTAHVEIRVHPPEGAECARAGAEKVEAGQTRDVLRRRGRHRWAQPLLFQPFAIAPVANDLLTAPLVVGARFEPLQLRAANEARQRMEQNEAGRSLRIGGREERPECATVVMTDEHGLLGVHGVHDRADVVHAGLEGREAEVAVGHAGSALVDADHTPERSEPAKEPGQVCGLPGDLDMLDEARNPDQIAGPLAQHLVGDVDLAAARVPGLWQHHCGKSPPPSQNAPPSRPLASSGSIGSDLEGIR